jgi:predicted nuclease with TOPRIM domain
MEQYDDFQKLVIAKQYIKMLKSQLHEYEKEEKPLKNENIKLKAKIEELQLKIFNLKRKDKVAYKADENLICENFKLKQTIKELENTNNNNKIV